MLEEYENWEDSIRKTFIELVDFQMKQHSDPIEFAIEFAWANGCDIFTINNAKDELKRLREKTKEWVDEVYRANEFAVEQTNEYLKVAKELDSIKDMLDKPVAYAKISKDGSLYDLNIRNNPYDDQTKVIPLYMINNNV